MKNTAVTENRNNLYKRAKTRLYINQLQLDTYDACMLWLKQMVVDSEDLTNIDAVDHHTCGKSRNDIKDMLCRYGDMKLSVLRHNFETTKCGRHVGICILSVLNAGNSVALIKPVRLIQHM